MWMVRKAVTENISAWNISFRGAEDKGPFWRVLAAQRLNHHQTRRRVFFFLISFPGNQRVHVIPEIAEGWGLEVPSGRRHWKQTMPLSPMQNPKFWRSRLAIPILSRVNFICTGARCTRSSCFQFSPPGRPNLSIRPKFSRKIAWSGSPANLGLGLIPSGKKSTKNTQKCRTKPPILGSGLAPYCPGSWQTTIRYGEERGEVIKTGGQMTKRTILRL